jgi:membrane associated rhomboid family serine protease
MTEFRPGSFQILPPVVKNLIIINSLMLFLQVVLEKFGFGLNNILGLHYWHSQLFKPWQLLTHMFMHGNLMHLFSNMFALWMFGSILENVWGPKRFLMFYLICGFGAALLHMGVVGYEFKTLENAFEAYQANPTLDKYDLFLSQHSRPDMGPALFELRQNWMSNPAANYGNQSVDFLYHYLYGSTDVQGHHLDGIFDEATVGASGAVFGILFAFGYLFPNTLLYFYFLVPIKAKYVVGAYALFELFSGIRNSAGDNVAHFAHLGGMLVAFIILKIWSRTARDRFY